MHMCYTLLHCTLISQISNNSGVRWAKWPTVIAAGYDVARLATDISTEQTKTELLES